MLERELHPHLAPDLVQVAALHVRIRPGEVDQLEDAQSRLRHGIAHRTRGVALFQDDDLARCHVPHELRPHDVQRGRFRGEDPADPLVIAPQARHQVVARLRQRQAAEDKRAEAMGIPEADDPVLVENDQAEGTAHAGQDMEQGLDRVGGRFVCDQRRQQLRVG